MTGELKSMFESRLIEPNQNDLAEKERNENEEKRKKDFLKKQTGMKKEFIKLVGGIPGIIPTGPAKVLTKQDKVQPWVWSRIYSSARSDGVALMHWQRKDDVHKDYEYAQLNKQIDIVEFTPEEYEALLKDPNWTYEETMYLFSLCKQFDLRFIVIHDKYDAKLFNKERTIEELKERYYSVARTILEHRRIYDHPIIKSGYNYEQEMKRRAYIERTLIRSPDEIAQEQSLLQQAEEIENKIQKYEKVEDNLKSLSKENKVGPVSFEDYIKQNATENDSFVYLRSQKLKHPLPVSEKLQRKVDTLIKELNIPEKLTPTLRVEQNYDLLRNNIVIYTTLKKHLEKKERELSHLNQKYHELQQTKLLANRNLVASTTISVPMMDQNTDMLSISSTGKDRKKTNGIHKVRKRKVPEEPQLESTPSSTKKRKKLHIGGK